MLGILELRGDALGARRGVRRRHPSGLEDLGPDRLVRPVDVGLWVVLLREETVHHAGALGLLGVENGSDGEPALALEILQDGLRERLIDGGVDHHLLDRAMTAGKYENQSPGQENREQPGSSSWTRHVHAHLLIRQSMPAAHGKIPGETAPQFLRRVIVQERPPVSRVEREPLAGGPDRAEEPRSLRWSVALYLDDDLGSGTYDPGRGSLEDNTAEESGTARARH